jgi:acyl-CoA thioesterase
MSLEEATALEPVGDGLWRGTISEEWWIIAGPFGGYVSAFFTRALQELASGRAPRSLTVHFLEPPQAGEVELAGEVLRQGGSMTSAALQMRQGDRVVASAMAAAAAWKDGQPEWNGVAPPQVPPPQECEEIYQSSRTPRFFRHFEIRLAPQREGEARNVAWMRPKPQRPLDHLSVTTLADGWMPAAFSKLGRPAIVPTLDLTIHFRAPLPHATEWTLVTNSSRVSAGGVWDEDTDVWAADGTLLAHARQLALIRA